VTVDGRSIAISGRTDTSNYAAEGNLYTLKVSDIQGRININNRHANLARILNNLGRRLNLSATIGDTIVAERARLLPDQRFTNVDQLAARLGRTAVDRLKPYLTVESWVDYKTLKPFGLTAGKRFKDASIGGSFYSYREMRPIQIAGPPPDPNYPLPPSPGTAAIDYEPRSPINVNSAAYEVLCALIEGLQGVFVKETVGVESDDYTLNRTTLTFTGNDPRTSGQVGVVYQTPPIGPNTAANIAGEFVKARVKVPTGSGPGVIDPRSIFRSYQQLADFIDLLPASVFDAGEITPPPGVTTEYAQQMVREVLKANFDPNCHLNEINPDEAVAYKVDKTDLLFWSFEFCFIPMGYFEIESLGRVVDGSPERREVASEKIVVQAKLFEVYRETTQADFQRDLYMNDENTALDLVAPPAESELRKSFSASSATTSYPKCGHVAAYPEPYYMPAYVQNAWYDGYLGLLPVENLPGGGGASLLCRFFNGLGSEKGGSGFTPDPGGGPWLTPVINSPTPGSLMTDGLLAEKDVSVGYDNRTFFNQHCGAVAFWLKPAFEPEHPGKTRFFTSVITYDLANDVRDDWTANPFCVGYLPHDLNTRGENYSTFRYASGWGDYFCRSVICGYAGAFRRIMGPPPGTTLVNGKWQKTWWNQDQIDLTTWWDYDAYPIGAMCDRICMNGTPTLNHVGHGHEFIVSADGKPWGNLLLQHRWIHIAHIWNDTVSSNGVNYLIVNGTPIPWHATAGDMTGQNMEQNLPYRNLNCLWGPPYGPMDSSGHQQIKVYAPANTAPDDVGFGLPPDGPNDNPDKLFRGRPEPPDIRVGGVCSTPIRSQWAVARNGGAGQRYVSNFPADATIDEVMTFLGSYDEQVASIMSIWREGRFYRSYGTPDKSVTAGGTLANFTSGRIKFILPASRPEKLAPLSNATKSSPTGTPPFVPGTPPPATAAAPSSVRLGLIMFTMRSPNYNSILMAYPSGTASGKVPVPRVFFDILDADTKNTLLDPSAVLGYNDASMSYLRFGGGAITFDGKAGGNPVDVDATKQIRYRLWLDSGFADDNARLNDPYTASPMIDDVTLTYARPRPVILSWMFGN
jgi:hypothetical protein